MARSAVPPSRLRSSSPSGVWVAARKADTRASSSASGRCGCDTKSSSTPGSVSTPRRSVTISAGQQSARSASRRTRGLCAPRRARAISGSSGVRCTSPPAIWHTSGPSGAMVRARATAPAHAGLSGRRGQSARAASGRQGAPGPCGQTSPARARGSVESRARSSASAASRAPGRSPRARITARSRSSSEAGTASGDARSCSRHRHTCALAAVASGSGGGRGARPGRGTGRRAAGKEDMGARLRGRPVRPVADRPRSAP